MNSLHPAAPLLALGLALSGVEPAGAAEASREWLDLWTRCRVAVERMTPLDVRDLHLGTQKDAEGFRVPPQEVTSGGHTIRITAGIRAPDGIWRTQEGRFWLTSWNERAQLHCSVSARGPALTLEDQALILRAFLNERGRLMFDASHRSRDPVFTGGLAGLGVGLATRNPAGRCTISSVTIDVNGDFFGSGSGPQLEAACDLPETSAARRILQ